MQIDAKNAKSTKIKTLRRQLLDKKMQKHKKSRTSKKSKKIKIALSRQLLVLPTCYYIIHLVQYHSVLVDLYAPQNAIMLLCNYAIIPV